MTTATRMIDLLDPTADAEPAHFSTAKRVESLSGKVVGLLDNGKSNFDHLLDDFEASIRAEYPTATILRRRKPSVSSPCPPDTMKELLEKCDIVITGLGD
ncbi:MAG: hypothetical protein HYY02_11425 [Chloroflexi bacterium]|nr:hypothetical protein [Chloroflexota bacterium]